MARKDGLGLTPEQERVLTLYHRMFVRAGRPARGRGAGAAEGGAAAPGEPRHRLRAERARRREGLDRCRSAPADLDGLPDDLVAAMAAGGGGAGRGRAIVLTLSRSLIVPFLQFSPRRDLRETAFQAWVARGENGGATDNRAIVAETLALREERARLLGYPDFASFKLEPEMARTPEAVRDLLMAVWAPARAQAEADAARLEELMRADGVNGALEPWDWRYYAAIRQAREHDFDQAALKPYLQLDNVLAAAFDVAGRLFGLSFHPIEADALPPRRPRLGGAARATATWASSSATISRAPRSARAPGARPSAASASSTARCGRSRQRLQLRQGAGRASRTC